MTARWLSLVALVAFAPAPVSAQEAAKPCELIITGIARGRDTTRIRAVTTASGGRDTYIGGGVDATCAGTGNRLLADSAEHFTERGVLILYDNVRYSEPRMSMVADRMFYHTFDERVVAEGNVSGKSAGGTRFSGPQFEYFRPAEGLRDLPYWIATGRPFVRMSPTEARPSDAPPPTTVEDSTDLTADWVYSINDSLLYASGQVVIERTDMRATSDSATIDNGIEFARLLRDPHVVGKSERPFALDGIVIDVWSKDRALQRVVAAGEAQAVSDSMTLTSDTVDLRFAEQKIEQIFVFGTRAIADADAQRIEADSMDIRSPGQRLEELRAVGRAKAWSLVDTTRVVTDERDWISGDTIRAQFETFTDSAGAERSRMREVIATGTARSFYQLPPSNGERGAPNISYNRGRQITVRFEAGDMSTVTVSEAASGIYLEAVTLPPADTARVDTTRTAPPARRP
jgi:lipopolysaccharide export system protein LptA